MAQHAPQERATTAARRMRIAIATGIVIRVYVVIVGAIQ
jgi:hypothetical protein